MKTIFCKSETEGGIEQQEAEGQVELCSTSRIPKEMLHGCTKEKLEEMGIKFCDEHDDIFWNCILPDAWRIRPTEHSMWNELQDHDGNVKADIFYKAAFYDRNAHISIRE